MNKIVLNIIFCFISINMLAQLKADAGINVYLCDSFGKSILAPLSNNRINKLIGGDPTASGGTAPYKYKWTFSYKTTLTSKPYIYASDILNDTSISNPILKDGTSSWFYSYPNKAFKVKLEVTDSIGAIALDSVEIIMSRYIYSGISSRYKLKNDTISFASNIGGGVSPLKFSWSPITYILDPSKNPMRTYSPIDITYSSTAIDSLGCKAGDIIELGILTSSIKIVKVEEYITNFHNPISQSSVFLINKSASIELIVIYNNLGQKLYSQKANCSFDIGNIIKEKGLFTLEFLDKDNRVNTFKILRE